MNRRRWLGGLGGALAAAALPAFAQSPRRVGVINPPAGAFWPDRWAGKEFVRAMAEFGHREGREVVYDFMEWRQTKDIPLLVREMLRRRVDVIVASAPPSIVAARSVTDSVPIVMVFSADPVATGLVESLNRPGGNLTGLSWDHGFETYVKQLELLQEALPGLKRLALLWDATDTAHPTYAEHFAATAKERKVELSSVGVRKPEDFDPAFARIRKERAEALIILPSAQLIIPNRREIMSLARRERLPTLAGPLHWDWPGALFLTAPSQAHVPRRAAAFVDRILRGAKPGELPIEQPGRYELMVDLRVARELGVKVAKTVVMRADKVVE